MRCSEPRQTLAVETDEERLGFTRIEAALADQHLQRFGQVTGDGYYALLAALAAQEHLRPRLIKMKIAQVDAERLGDTRTGSPEKKRPYVASATALDVRSRLGHVPHMFMIWVAFMAQHFLLSAAARSLSPAKVMRMSDW